MTDLVSDFAGALLALDRLKVRQIMDDQESCLTPMEFVDRIIVPALERIGEGWHLGTVALSQVYMAGRICEELISGKITVKESIRRNQPRMAVCTLIDHHGLGKNIVRSVLRASGFQVVDFGTMEVDRLVEKVIHEKIDVLMVSVLMLASALEIKTVRDRLADKGQHTVIIVGGAPFRFDDNLWMEVGATAMCRSASGIVPLVIDIMEGKAA